MKKQKMLETVTKFFLDFVLWVGLLAVGLGMAPQIAIEEPDMWLTLRQLGPMPGLVLVVAAMVITKTAEVWRENRREKTQQAEGA